MKKCCKCKQDKELDKYAKKSKSEDGLNPYCKSCIKEMNHKYYENDKKNYNSKSKKWYEKNKEKHIKHTMQYQLNNPEKKKGYVKKWQKNNREYFKKWVKNQYDNNPNYKLRITLSNRLKDILKRKNNFKNNSITKLIGCTLGELREHIEKQFLPEFNWNNWGPVWELDHIKPCSKFDLTIEDEQKQCFHHTNLMPRFKTTEIAEQHGSDQIGNRNKGAN